MNIALIGDFHFGIKKSNDTFIKSQIKFIKEGFIPYLKKHGIKTIFMLGDLFDTRSHLNVKTKNAVFDLFENEFKDFEIFILIGNHDIYYNSTIAINSLKWLKKFDNVHLVEDIEEIKIGKQHFLFIPWQVQRKNFYNYVADNNIKSKVAFGHFNISGFHLNKNKLSIDGDDSNIFYDNFKLVFSGHFHTRSRKKRNSSEIVYIGAPYHLTRHDIGEEKGFCILDTDTNKFKYVNNDISIRFVSINYPQRVTKSLINGNIIDVHIKYDKNYNEDRIQQYIRTIEKFGPVLPPNVKVINEFNYNSELKNHKIKNTYELMYEYIQNLDIENKAEIYSTLEKLYQESKSDI